MTRRTKSALRILITTGLLALALYLVDLDLLVAAAADVRVPWIVAGFGLILLIIALEAVQFALVAEAMGQALTWGASLRMAFVGRFFALFTPSVIGSDVYRASSMYGRGAGKRGAISVTVISRLLSLASLGPVLVAGVPLLARYTESKVQFAGYTAVGLSVLLFTYVLLGLRAPATTLPSWLTRSRAISEMIRAAADLRFVALQSPMAGRIWASAISQHVIRAIAIAMVARAFGVDASLWVFFAFVPVSLLIAMVPVSVGSWGVRELTLVYGLGLAGVPASSALLTSIAFGLLGTCVAVFGGLVWMMLGEGAPRNRDHAA